MQLYLDVAMSEKTEKEKCKAFLYVIGKEGREIFNTFVFAEEQQDKLEPLLENFESYPRKMSQWKDINLIPEHKVALS